MQKFYPLLMAFGLAILLAPSGCATRSNAVRCDTKLERINPDPPPPVSEAQGDE